MKFLHTSDWHLGKLFHEKSMIEDQCFMLEQIFQIMKNASEQGSPYAALVMSGDIYDRAVPPSEAVTLLDSFLNKLITALPDTHIFMNAGNHDSASRLSYGAAILEKHNIHFATNTKQITTPVILDDAQFSRPSQKVAFYQLPFLTPLSLSPVTSSTSNQASPSDKLNEERSPLRSQQELYTFACKEIITHHKKMHGDMPSVLNAHLFTSGSATAASERTNIGSAEQVDVSLFKDFTYGAFGHIHKYQPCDKEKHCYYPGALLAYSFDDNPENGILEIEIKNEKNISINRIPIKPLHPIAKIKAQMSELIGSNANQKLINENYNNYVQVILTDEVMPTEAFSTLKTVFPNLLSVVSNETSFRKTDSSIQERKAAILSNDPEKIFIQFMKEANGDDEENDLFQKQKEIFVQEATHLFAN